MNTIALRLCTFALIILSAVHGIGQESRAIMLLDLKQIYAEYEQAKSNYDRAVQQLDAGSITKDEYGSWESELFKAEIRYQKHLLGILGQSIYLTVEEAVKYSDANGQPRVSLRIRCVLQGDQEYLSNLEQGFVFSAIEFQPDQVYDVYVSLVDLETDIIISKPYERHIPALVLGRDVSLDFSLLRDVDGLQVHLAYMGKSENKRIFLQRGMGSAMISISSAQFSQDADLGGEATFNITVDHVPIGEEIVQLHVINLPRQITYEISEVGTQVRSSQMKFTPTITRKELALKVRLPDRTNELVVLNKPLEFYIAASPQVNQLQIDRNARYAANELTAMEVGMVRLELFPRGAGQLEIKASNLYFEVESNEGIETDVQVRNDGTISLVNVKVLAEAPTGWTVKLDPAEIVELPPGQERRVTVSLSLPPHVGVGAQELTLHAEALSAADLVESDEKTIRIVIKKELAVGTIVLLAALIIIVVSAIIVFGVRVTRR